MNKEEITNERIEKLSKISLFEGLSIEELEKVISIAKIVHMTHDTFIIKEDTIGTEMYIILKGSVRVLKKTFSNDLYTVVDLSDKENAFFGEFSLIDNDKRSASILALTDCLLLSINKADFEEMAKTDYKIGYYVLKNVARRLSGRLRSTNKDVITLFEALENELDSEE